MIFNLMKPVPVQTATVYLYGQEADKTVTYNGVELPEFPVWDKEQYPYAIVSYNSAGFYSLRCFSTEPSASSKANLTLVPYSESGYSISTTSQENGWGEFGEPLEFVGIAQSFTKGIIWTNFDLRYKGTEDVYFEATDPVTTYTNADVTIDGVGYVGAVLPALPDDIAKYPYAVMCTVDGVYGLAISNGVPSFEGETLHMNGGGLYYWRLGIDDDWHIGENHTNKNDFTWTASWLSGKTIFWSNVSILRDDGNVYLSASDPIPVYE